MLIEMSSTTFRIEMRFHSLVIAVRSAFYPVGAGGGGLYSKVKRPKRESDHLLPFNTEVKKG